MGRATLTAFVTNFSFRAIAAFDFGPGGTETIFGPRSSFFVRFAMVSWLVRRPKGTPRSEGWRRGNIGFPSPRTRRCLARVGTAQLEYLICQAHRGPVVT